MKIVLSKVVKRNIWISNTRLKSIYITLFITPYNFDLHSLCKIYNGRVSSIVLNNKNKSIYNDVNITWTQLVWRTSSLLNRCCFTAPFQLVSLQLQIEYKYYVDKQVALTQRFTTRFTPIKVCVDTVQGTSNLSAKCRYLCLCPLHLSTSKFVQENCSWSVM